VGLRERIVAYGCSKTQTINRREETSVGRMIVWIPSVRPYVLNVTNPFSLTTYVPIAGFYKGREVIKVEEEE